MGPGGVVIEWRIAGTARGSGALSEMRVATDFTIADGKVVRGREWTREEALAAIERGG